MHGRWKCPKTVGSHPALPGPPRPNLVDNKGSNMRPIMRLLGIRGHESKVFVTKFCLPVTGTAVCPETEGTTLCRCVDASPGKVVADPDVCTPGCHAASFKDVGMSCVQGARQLLQHLCKSPLCGSGASAGTQHLPTIAATPQPPPRIQTTCFDSPHPQR